MLKCVHSEPTVRAELMEQVPNIAMFLHEHRPNFPAAFSRYLVPIVVRYLTDPNNQVGYRFLVFLDDITNILKPQSVLLLGANKFFSPDKIVISFLHFLYKYIYIFFTFTFTFYRFGKRVRQRCLFCWSRALSLKLTWRPKFVQFCSTWQNLAVTMTTKSRQLL